MPRKYRPPAAKRRKNRATNIPYDTGVAEENNTWAAEATVESPAETTSVDLAEPALEADGTRGEERVSLPKERHIMRDYSYVRGEVARILVIASLLFAGLIVVAIIRN